MTGAYYTELARTRRREQRIASGRRSKYKPKWNILRPSHHPQYGPRSCDDFHRRFHDDLVEEFPEPFERASFYPYGVWLVEDGTQVMFDREYRPMWIRPGERQPAVQADPAQWIEWCGMYFLHDDKPAPEHSRVLRECLMHVMQQFIRGGPLLVRRWEPKRIDTRGWVLVAREPVRPPSATGDPVQ